MSHVQQLLLRVTVTIHCDRFWPRADRVEIVLPAYSVDTAIPFILHTSNMQTVCTN